VLVMCPVCSANVAGQKIDAVCPKCQVDLSAYLAVQYTPDILYNEAVRLAEGGEIRAAYDKLAAAHYLRPHDTEIIIEMSRCLELIGDYMGAMEKIATLIIMTGGNDSFKQEYERLNALLVEQRRDENLPSVLDQNMFDELKVLIRQAMRESVKEIIISVK